MNHDTNQLYMDHTQQPLEGTSRVICCPGSGVGILLNLDPVSIFWKLISCWLQHLQIFSSFPEAVFSVLFMVYLVLQILLTRSPLFLLLFPRLQGTDPRTYSCDLCQRVFYVFLQDLVLQIFRSLIYFDFIFVCIIRESSNIILLHTVAQIFQHYLLKRLSSIHHILLPILSQIN